MATHVAVSILNADLTGLGRICRDVEAAGASSIQVDVMDGHFVPELAFGPQVAAAVVQNSGLPIEAHLMVEHPEQFVHDFAATGVRDYIFHVEATGDVGGLVSAVHATGMRAGVAIKLETPPEVLTPFLAMLHMIVVMGIPPGRGGQTFDRRCLRTLSSLSTAIRAQGVSTQLQVDGGINESTAPEAVAAGANALIAGSYLFRHPGGYRAAIESLTMVGAP